MKKSIFLFFAAILCAIGMNAATVTSDGTARLYFNMSAVSWWTAGTNGDGNFAYFYGSSGNKWSAHSVKHSGNDYYVVIPAGTWDHVILTRNKTSTSPSWDNKWNQTGNIELSSSTNYLSKFSADSESVTWGTAIKPTSTASVASSAASVFVGVPANLTASLTSNANINTIKSVAYSTTTGASITGNTFTATAEGTYTVTATVTYHPNGYPSLTSTATATTTITAAVPAEEVHDVTVSYMCGGEGIADATTVLSVGVETSVKVTAPEIAKYTFANWTLGADIVTTDGLTSNEINITTKTGGSDFTLVANYEKAKLTYTVTVPSGTENCYLVGAMNGWDVANPIEMTKQGENVFTTTLEGVATTDEYKYISQKGSWDYADVQDANRTWTANDVVTAWKDPLATNVYLVGNMFTNWDKTPDKEFRKATKDATTASIVVALDADKDYELKVRRGDDWTSCTSKITNTVTGLLFSSSNSDNCKMKTTVAGEYTFTWTISSSKLDVKYPTLYAVTATANDAAMGTIAGAGDYGKGSTATLTATPNDGYLFVNWTKGGVEVSTDATYSFKVTEAVELVANFEAAAEEVHNVTVSYVCGGNKIADDQPVAAVGETTAKTVEAPAIFGYTFSSWILGAGVTSANELTSNTIDINIVAGGSDYTLTANYTEIPKVTVYFVNNKNWSKVQVYGWKDGEAQGTPGWPGNNITENKEAEQVADFDVYSYSVVPGSYHNIIFNNKEGGSGEQTETFKWADGKYYYMGAAENYAGGTKEEVATALGSIVTYDYYVIGTVNGWALEDVNFGMELNGDIYEKEVALAIGKHELKINNGTWTDNANIFGYDNLSVAYEGVSRGSGDGDNNIVIDLAEAKPITVKLDKNTKKITLDGLTEKAPEPTFDYYIAGSFNGDNPKKAENGMTLDGTVYKATVTLAAGDNTLKVTDGTWENTWGATELGAAYEEVSNPNDYNNIKITLAAEKSITVIFDATAGKITFEGLTPYVAPLTYTVTVPAGTEKCYIAGAFAQSNWNTFLEMEQVVGEDKFTITITGAKESDEYKYACQASWDYKELDKDGNEVANRTWSELDEVEKWGKPAVVTYVLMGVNNDWTTGIALTQNPDNADEYVLENQVIIKATDAVKVVTLEDGVAKAWCGNVDSYSNATYTGGGNDNIVLEDGIYTFYFKKTANNIYINQTGYARTATSGSFSTICLPYAGTISGATLFDLSDRDANYVYVVEAGTELEAGKPYVILPTEDKITVTYKNYDYVAAGSYNALHGTYDEMNANQLNGKYVITGNQYYYVDEVQSAGSKLLAYRAYFNLNELPTVPASAPGVRRIALGTNGQNTATGMENVDASAQPVKTIINGQLFILRGEKMYDAQGKLVK